MRKPFAFWFLHLLLFAVCLTASGKSVEEYNSVYLNMTTGLPSNFVDDVFEDSYGFIWLSTHGGGLARFDGYSYRYMDAGGQGLTMKSNSCRNTAEDRFRRLWVTFDECTEVMDLRTLSVVVPPCTTETLTRQLKTLLQEPGIRSYQDAKGNFWLATQRHIYRFMMDTEGTITDIQAHEILLDTPDIAICDVDKNGSVYVYYDAKPWLIASVKGKLRAQDLSRRFPKTLGLFVTTILPYDNKIWFASNEGLYCSDGKSWNVSSGLKHNFVSALATAPDGRLMIGTLMGVSIMDTKTGSVEQWNTFSTANPLSSNFVNCIFSKNRQIWIGTESGGIVKLTPRQLNLVNYIHNDANPHSISQNAVNAMYLEPNGTLWVGTVEGGLNRKETGNQRFTHYNTGNSHLSHNSVSALEADKYGRLWIGTWAGGVNVMDLRTPGEITHLDITGDHERLLRFVGALAYDPINDGLWIGTNDGLYFYDFRKARVEEPFEGCRNIRGCIGSIVTKDGKLWMGCLEGVVQVDLKSRKGDKKAFKWTQYRNKLDRPTSVTRDKITAFCQADDGTLWLGSSGYGLYKMTVGKNGKPSFVNFTTNQGLANNVVKGIVADKHGLLWITTDNGLSVFNPKTRVFTNFSEDDGLACSQFYFNSAAISPDGVIYLGTGKGMTEIRGVNTQNYHKGHLSFTRLFVGNQEVGVGNYLKQDVAIAKEINLHESDKSFSIEFSALNYGPEKYGLYSYRMKGFEDDWIPLPPGQHSVRYTTLPSGDYEFEVKYTSGFNNEEQHASIHINVTPYFWKSWWFVTLLIIAVLSAAYYLYKRRLDTLRKREVDKLYKPIEAALMESEEPGKLQRRIKSILDNQKLFRHSRDKTVEEDKREVARRMKPFMEVLINIMEKNYANSEFGVQDLAAQMNMSRATLNKRVIAETGNQLNQFMRNYRLGVAKKMLEDNTANRHITEIAYRVGFNDPKYFTRCFTKEYGISPSSYKL